MLLGNDINLSKLKVLKILNTQINSISLLKLNLNKLLFDKKSNIPFNIINQLKYDEFISAIALFGS